MSWLAKLFGSDSNKPANDQSPKVGVGADAIAIAEYCRAKLDLAKAERVDDDRYRSLPLCVIDAVFSINARYASVENVIDRFCKRFGLKPTSHTFPPKVADQLSISDFMRLYDKHGVEGMATAVYQNQQRTSTRNGILKAEAVWHFCRVLREHGVEYLQDMNKVMGQAPFEAAIQGIPGQRSGLSLRYFYMLAGSDDYVKPDRMIARFIMAATGKSMTIEAAHDSLVAACRILQQKHPKLTPRQLDHQIWQYQREQGVPD